MTEGFVGHIVQPHLSGGEVWLTCSCGDFVTARYRVAPSPGDQAGLISSTLAAQMDHHLSAVELVSELPSFPHTSSVADV